MPRLSLTTITLFKWLGGFSALLVLVSLIATPWIIARLPADYFKQAKPHFFEILRRASLLHCGWICFKNLLGIVLLLCGVGLLLLPGQGLLTIFTGLCLIDFPHKQHLESKLVRHPRVLAAINWARRRAKRPDLEI